MVPWGWLGSDHLFDAVEVTAVKVTWEKAPARRARCHRHTAAKVRTLFLTVNYKARVMSCLVSVWIGSYRFVSEQFLQTSTKFEVESLSKANLVNARLD
jgi:hypothetical protein